MILQLASNQRRESLRVVLTSRNVDRIRIVFVVSLLVCFLLLLSKPFPLYTIDSYTIQRRSLSCVVPLSFIPLRQQRLRYRLLVGSTTKDFSLNLALQSNPNNVDDDNKDDSINDDGNMNDWSMDSSTITMNEQAVYDSMIFQSSMIQYVSKYLHRLNTTTSNETTATTIDDDDDDYGDRMISTTSTTTPPDGEKGQSNPTNWNITTTMSNSYTELPTMTTMTSWTTTSSATSILEQQRSQQQQQQPQDNTSTSMLSTKSSLDSAQQQQPLKSSVTTLSYMIGIPISTTKKKRNSNQQQQLLTEIESIQRAITYHCPILQSSCISTTSAEQLRIPLLYLTISTASSYSSYNTTMIVQQLLHQVVMDVIRNNANNTTTTNQQYQEHDIDDVDTDDSSNFVVSCSKLGIDGGSIHSQNEILYTIVQDDVTSESSVLSNPPGCIHMIYQMMNQFQQSIQQQQQELYSEEQQRQEWTVQFPKWITKNETTTNTLRLPIMRLPSNWENVLLEQQQITNSITKTFSTTNVDVTFLSSDQGGNGISPLFWGKYMDDIFVQGYALEQISIYPYRLNDNDNEDKSDIEWTETNFPSVATSVSLRNTKNDKDHAIVSILEERIGKDFVLPQQPENGIKDDDFSTNDENGINRDRMNRIIASQQRLMQSNKVVKQPTEYNPLFEKYRSGTLVPKMDSSSTLLTDKSNQKPVPSFPNRELAIGFWRMVRSPTGFENENNNNDITKSDNLILRVDGSIAGGPILNTETRQKAAGGTWTYTESETTTSTASNSDRTIIDDTSSNMTHKLAKLQIRFIIPPKKDRVLVMEGQFQKMSTIIDEDNALNSDTTYVCSGNVWMEDNIVSDISSLTSSLSSSSSTFQRDEIGTFTIMKILNSFGTDPSQLSITIPKNVRYLD